MPAVRFWLDGLIDPGRGWSYNWDMRASLLFLPPKGRTPVSQKNNPTRLLVEGGYIRKIGEGLYVWLPLGMLVVRHMVSLIQHELKKLGGQEVLLPVLNPMELWEATGRDVTAAQDLFVLKDHKDRDLVLTPAHEESMLELIRDIVRDDWQLPAFFYQFQSKARNVDSSRDGILKPREFLMYDGYSIHRSFAELNNFVPKMHRAFTRVFAACGLQPLVAEGVPFHTGGDRSYDFLILHRSGDYKVVTCEKCGYVADQQVALGLSRIAYSRPRPLERACRDGLANMQSLVRELGLPSGRFVLCRLYRGVEGLVLLVYRADREPSLHKAGKLAGTTLVGELGEAETAGLGLVPHFVSPLGIAPELLARLGIRVLVDSLVAETPNLLMGANAPGSYWINVNFGRDFEAASCGDLSMVDEGNRCYHCGGALKLRQALRMASVYRLKDHYTRKLGFAVTRHAADRAQGTLAAAGAGPGRGAAGTGPGTIYPHMGSYALSIDRLVAAVATACQDDRGLRWPLELAPYKAVLQVVGKSASLHRLAEEIHGQLSEHVLWDDRPLSFVSKCHDADRLGIPMRIIVSAASLTQRSALVLSRTGPRFQRVPITRLKGVLVDYWREERQAAGLGEDP